MYLKTKHSQQSLTRNQHTHWVIIKMKAIERYSFVVLFIMLYRVVLLGEIIGLIRLMFTSTAKSYKKDIFAGLEVINLCK